MNSAAKDLTVGFAGLGLMGQPMASRLLSVGHPLMVWNRSVEKASELLAQGARWAETPAELAAEADVVILMLADGPTVTELLFGQGMADAMRTDTIVIDMSSISPGLARDHCRRLAKLGVHHLDAPVSGGTRGAAEGTLAIMVGGDAVAFDAARPVLDVMGRPTLIGPSGTGQVAKLANQAIVAVTIGAVAEALVLAAAGGADPAQVKEALSGGFADSMILKQHGQRMLDRNWVPGGPTRMQVKDLRTIVATAAELGLNLPLANCTAGLFESMMASGLGEYDHSALLLQIEKINPGKNGEYNPNHPTQVGIGLE
jgi:2-hydroxy-3-oxopropionate reductase